MAYVGLGDVQCERNDLERATQTLHQGLRLLLGTIEDEPIIRGNFALARIAQARGDPAEAHASVQRAESWFQQIQFARPWTMARLEALHARLWIWQGNLTPALRWAEDSGLTALDPPDRLTYASEIEYLTLARLRIAQGRIDPTGPQLTETLLLLDHLLLSAETARRMGSMIDIHTLRALALHAQGSFAAALNSLESALNLAEPEGYVRIFLDEGGPMHALLLMAGRLKGHGLQKSIQRLLLEFEKHAPTPQVLQPKHSGATFQPSTLIEPLTARELDILRPVAEGASNQAIAERLYLSTGTVKVHLKHIFGKLGVNSRTQAIVRARELNLL
jgi:LuxR family transcriptional regulator, maltose regulon positive regulatory protein